MVRNTGVLSLWPLPTNKLRVATAAPTSSLPPASRSSTRTKGLMNEPTRCQSCRSARRASQSTLEQNDGYVRYGNFASFGGKTPRQMHPRILRRLRPDDRGPLRPTRRAPRLLQRLLQQGQAAARRGRPSSPHGPEGARHIQLSRISTPQSTTTKPPGAQSLRGPGDFASALFLEAADSDDVTSADNARDYLGGPPPLPRRAR